MMTFKKKWISVLASALAFVVCATFGIVFALDTNKVSAAEESKYEAYDVLYTDDFSNKGTALTDGVFNIENEAFLTFTPSSENTSGSFVWNFKYTSTVNTGAINIYALSAAAWQGTVNGLFDFNNLPIVSATETGFTAGQTYDVEYSVLKVKGTDNTYDAHISVNGKNIYSKTMTDGKGQGLYFYTTDGATGTCYSERPTVTPDKLTNSDWKIGNQNNEVVPTVWDVDKNDFGKYIYFTPSAENTTASFVWEFDFLCTTRGTSDTGKSVNVFPFAGNTWPQGISPVDIAAKYSTTGFAVGEIYKIEIGVIYLNNRLNDNYRFYIAVDGVVIHDVELSGALKNGTSCGDGLYIIFNNNGARGTLVGEEKAATPDTPVEPVDPYAAYVDTYDVLYNSDWTTTSGTLGTTWDMANNYYLDFTPTADNTTNSFVWKFKYTHTATSGSMNIYAFANGVWGNTANATVLDFNKCGFTAGQTYEVEICVLKLKDSNNYELFYVVNGEKKASKTISATWTDGNSSYAAENADGLYFYFTGTGVNGTCLEPMRYDAYVDTYDVLNNQDWTVLNASGVEQGRMARSWNMVHDYVIRFNPSTENTTGSFLWKYTYTHNAAGDGNRDMHIYPLSSGSWNGSTYFDYDTCGFVVGQTYEVELGVLKLKDSTNYEVVVIVDGVKVFSGLRDESTKKGNDLYFYFENGAKGTCVSLIDDPIEEIDYSQYEAYDVLYNQNWTLYQTRTDKGPMPKDWTITSGYSIKFTPSEQNTTGSYIWKFTYTLNSNGDATNSSPFYMLSSGYYGSTNYIFFNGNQNSKNHIQLDVGTYDMEIGALRVKGSDSQYFVFIRANGKIIYNYTYAPTHNNDANNTCVNNGCSGVAGDFSAHTGIFFVCGAGYSAKCTSPVEISDVLETYDTLYNSDWKEHNQNTLVGDMPVTWTTSAAGKFLDFTPSAENTTGSYIWKSKFTMTTKGNTANIYPLASGNWGGDHFINFVGTANSANNINLTAGVEYDMEFAVLKIKNSQYYYLYIKTDGNVIYEQYVLAKHNTSNNQCVANGCSQVDGDFSAHTGIYFYNTDTTMTFKQDGVVVEVNGETKLVASGTTVLEIVGGVSGLLPADRPSGYTTTWYDSKGNKVNAATEITENTTLTFSYTYNYTIVSVNGELLYSHKHIYGNEASYNSDALTVDGMTFIGYLVGDTLYYDLADAIDASAAIGESIVANTVTLGLIDGASIRVDGTPSIRFTATIDKSAADAETKIVNYGMLLTTKATLDMIADFTIAELELLDDDSLYHNLDKANGLRYVENSKYPNQYVYSLILDKVSASNYGVQYVARAYAVVEYADGTYAIVYSEFDKDAHTRSMYEVASAAIDDTQHDYTQAQKVVIQQHIDGVIYLDSAFALDGQARNYDVTVTKNSDETYTVKVTAKNGFDIKNIGAIYVGGEKIPVYDANLSAGTFVIKEEDMSVITLNTFNTFLSAQTEQRELIINAYSGPSLGLKVDKSGAWVDSGYDFTLADLETYMAAGFDAWRLEISPYTQVLNYAPKGTVVADIYYALDLAAQYAQKHNKPCKVYVNIPEVTGLVNTAEGKTAIGNIYTALVNYDDGITKNLTGVSTVNKKNQIAGFLLKDEPKLSDATNFETMFDYLNDNCGAGAAGYDYQIALLQSYAGEENIGKDFNAYVATYAEILSGIKSVGFDSYPFIKSEYWYSSKESYSFEDEWFYLLETYKALKNGYTTCIQSYIAGKANSGAFSNNSYKSISCEEEISMQVYTALAYGYTNLDYFTYGDRIDYDRQVASEIYQDVPVQWNNYSDWSKGYTLKSMYGWIKNTNTEAISLYDALGKFTNNGVQLIKGSTTNNIFGNATTTNTTNAIGVTSTYDMVVGGFECGSYNGYLAVNADLPTQGNRTTSATFTLTGYTKAIVYINGIPEVKRITDGTLTMNIGAGEGVFIVPMN